MLGGNTTIMRVRVFAKSEKKNIDTFFSQIKKNTIQFDLHFLFMSLFYEIENEL